MALTLEQEFEKKKQEVMKSVVGTVTAQIYINEQLTGVTIPSFLIDKEELVQRANLIAYKNVERLVENNELEQAFEESWQAVASFLP